jgi:hypothetical protein
MQGKLPKRTYLIEGNDLFIPETPEAELRDIQRYETLFKLMEGLFDVEFIDEDIGL